MSKAVRLIGSERWEADGDQGDDLVASAGGGRRQRPLLIADDEADDELLPALRDQGMEVSVVTDGALALLEIGRLDPSVILISARLPIVDGVTLIRTVRSVAERTGTPILFAVGADDREQASAALEAGASACVGKPYRVHEVLAMVGAAGAAGGASATMAGAPGGQGEPAGVTGPGLVRPRPGPAVLRVGPVVLDVDAHEVTVSGRAVHMPPREFRLLHLLLGNAGRVVTRETLLTEVWGSPDTDPNTLAVHVRRLRRRLGDSISTTMGEEPGTAPPTGGAAAALVPQAPGSSKAIVTARVLLPTRPPFIESIRGVGYRFRPPSPHPA